MFGCQYVANSLAQSKEPSESRLTPLRRYAAHVPKYRTLVRGCRADCVRYFDSTLSGRNECDAVPRVTAAFLRRLNGHAGQLEGEPAADVCADFVPFLVTTPDPVANVSSSGACNDVDGALQAVLTGEHFEHLRELNERTRRYPQDEAAWYIEQLLAQRSAGPYPVPSVRSHGQITC